MCMQPPKRGLSLEEKRSKLLDVFHESRDVFVLKVRMHDCAKVRAWACSWQLPCLLTMNAVTTGHREAGIKEGHRIAEHQGRAAGERPLLPA